MSKELVSYVEQGASNAILAPGESLSLEYRYWGSSRFYCTFDPDMITASGSEGRDHVYRFSSAEELLAVNQRSCVYMKFLGAIFLQCLSWLSSAEDLLPEKSYRCSNCAMRTVGLRFNISVKIRQRKTFGPKVLFVGLRLLLRRDKEGRGEQAIPPH